MGLPASKKVATADNKDMVQADLSALVYDKKTNSYIPYNKEWVKATALRHLKGQAVNTI